MKVPGKRNALRIQLAKRRALNIIEILDNALSDDVKTGEVFRTNIDYVIWNTDILAETMRAMLSEKQVRNLK